MKKSLVVSLFFFFKQKTAYEIGLGIPAEPLFFDSSEISESVNFCVMEAIKLCRLDTPIIFIEARINLSRFVVRLRRQNVGYSNFSQPQSHLSFCVLLQYLVERRRVVTQLGKLD